jgi:hypothetical protein
MSDVGTPVGNLTKLRNTHPMQTLRSTSRKKAVAGPDVPHHDPNSGHFTRLMDG